MFSVLGIGLSGVQAAQRAVENAAHNVANANTDGYTRQRVTITSARPVPGTPGLRGSGVHAIDVARLRDALADLAFRGETAAGGAWSARAEVLGRAQQVLGPYGEGAPAAVSRFWAAWQQLSTSPTDPASRQGVLDAGAALARTLNSAADGLDRLSLDVSARVDAGVAEANAVAGQLARLNAAISDATTAGQTPNDLLDERDRALDRLVRLTGATVRESETGRVDVYVGSQALVRGETVAPLSATRVAGVTSVAHADGSPAALGGQLGGYVDTLVRVLPALHADLDAVASGLASTVNATHRAGFDLDGAAGGDFFTGTTARSLAVDPALTIRGVAASAFGAPADGNNALALAQLRSAGAVGGVSVGDAVNAFAGRLGAEAANATASARAAELVVSAVEQQRAESNGVSVNEEMADLVRYQRAYEAAARVVTVADELLDRLINGMGAR